MEYTAEAIGLEIRALRERRGMSQEALGEQAKYGAGAGVSISRIESGETRPPRTRLANIAGALGVTLERLEQLAVSRSNRPHAFDDESAAGTASDRRQSLNERLKDVQHRTSERADQIERLTIDFDHAHKQARDDFFLRFVSIGQGIDGSPESNSALAPSQPYLGNQVSLDSPAAIGMAILSDRVLAALAGGAGGAATGAALGGATAYATFTGVARFGTASTGTPIAGLSGIVATNATLAMLGGGALAAGGGGIAGGTLVLRYIVAAPLAALAIGGFFIAYRLSKTIEADLKAKLDTAEKTLETTQTGFDVLVKTITRATSILHYIGVHGAHALERWQASLPTEPIAWSELSGEQQRAYRDFIDVAACQLAVDSIETPQFLTAEGDALKNLSLSTASTLDFVEERIRQLV